jgi:hypothetical protein
LIRTGLPGYANLFITGILHKFIWHTFAQEGAWNIFNNIVLF